MKYIGKISLGLALCMGLFVSCKDDNNLNSTSGITVDKQEITIGPDGGVESIKVISGTEWLSSSSKPWVMISPANGFGSVDGTLAIDSTLEVKARQAQVRFRQSDNSETIVGITQFGYGKQIIPAESEIEIPNSEVYEKRYFDVKIATNVAFKIDDEVKYIWGEEIPETEVGNVSDSDLKNWITLPGESSLNVDLDRKDRPRTITVRFRWEMNTAPYKRVAKIKLLPKNNDDILVDQDGNPTGEVVLTVTQEPAVKITDDRRGDSLAIVMINQKIQTMMPWEYSENMSNWEHVTLWEEDSEDKPKDFNDEWVGRVRSVGFYWMDLKAEESFPKEIKYLKYLESLTIETNVNRQARDMHLCEEVCELEHLKELNVYAYGLVDLPKNFSKLAKTLEYLDLGSNNFPKLSTITDVVNADTFKELKGLQLSTGRRNDTTNDLSASSDKNIKEGELGIYVNLDANDNDKEKQAFMTLLGWENLEYLGLSYLFIEGSLPTDEEMKALEDESGQKIFKPYEQSDWDEYELPKDTCDWLLTTDKPIIIPGKTAAENKTVTGQDILKVLPRMKMLTLNLNFLTGDMPNWLLFHPYFMSWSPDGLIIPQWIKGKDTQGNNVGFANVGDNNPNFNYKYYYGDGTAAGSGSAAYPGYYNKYVGGGVDWKPSTDAGSDGTEGSNNN